MESGLVRRDAVKLLLLPHVRSTAGAFPVLTMTRTIEVSDGLAERIDRHCEEGESRAEFVEELVSMYETEGRFMQEGYSE